MFYSDLSICNEPRRMVYFWYRDGKNRYTYQTQHRLKARGYFAMNRTVLVVDDMLNVQKMLLDFLETQGFSVLQAFNGFEALEILKRQPADLILLDIMMPSMDGFLFIRQLRQTSSIPVIMMTALHQEADIIRGFDLGADDYLIKPFRLRELLVRIRAVLRRSSGQANRIQLSAGGLLLNHDWHEVSLNGKPIAFTPVEYFLLFTLMQNAGKVMSKGDLLNLLVENGFSGSESTLKIHISHIRSGLGESAEMPNYIETVFGVGYRFKPEVLSSE